ncbi:hypothetical protein [Gimesia chilikensis]|uniref:hypothetical protein n=1 Tax=Gimesia chilikensis TaxID=2605989 RepID=UPI001659FB0E|nr:hypothetical protein [Gimesia chilikensis]
MKGISFRVLIAAAVLGISPLFLPAQLQKDVDVDQPTAGAKAVPGVGKNTKAGTNTKVEGSVQSQGQNALDKDTTPTPPRTKSSGKVRGQTDTQLKDKTDAYLQNGADAQNKTDVQLQNQNDADMPLRHQTNRPNLDASGQLQGQANSQIDPIVLEGTAHLDIDEATRARYRFHNDHWWYQTEQGRWLIDNNGTWQPFDPVSYRNPRFQMRGPQTFQGDEPRTFQNNSCDFPQASTGDTDFDDGSQIYGNYFRRGRYHNRHHARYHTRPRYSYYGSGYYSGYYNPGYYYSSYNNPGYYYSGYYYPGYSRSYYSPGYYVNGYYGNWLW